MMCKLSGPEQGWWCWSTQPHNSRLYFNRSVVLPTYTVCTGRHRCKCHQSWAWWESEVAAWQRRASLLSICASMSRRQQGLLCFFCGSGQRALSSQPAGIKEESSLSLPGGCLSAALISGAIVPHEPVVEQSPCKNHPQLIQRGM